MPWPKALGHFLTNCAATEITKRIQQHTMWRKITTAMSHSPQMVAENLISASALTYTSGYWANSRLLCHRDKSINHIYSISIHPFNSFQTRFILLVYLCVSVCVCVHVGSCAGTGALGDHKGRQILWGWSYTWFVNLTLAEKMSLNWEGASMRSKSIWKQVYQVFSLLMVDMGRPNSLCEWCKQSWVL